MEISEEQISERKSYLSQFRNVILELRKMEKEIADLVAKSDAKWQSVENQKNVVYRQIEPIMRDYWSWVPDTLVSFCPFCHGDLYRKFDPVDFQGLWWMDRTQRPVDEISCCSHFCFLSGAVAKNGAEEETLYDCYSGPEKPFVIPSILEFKSVKAVITEIDMLCGYTAFPIVYFSKEDLLINSHSKMWTKRDYQVSLDNGCTKWDIVDKDKDFNLDPWIEKGKVIMEKIDDR